MVLIAEVVRAAEPIFLDNIRFVDLFLWENLIFSLIFDCW